MLETITLPKEKQCDFCKETRPFTSFYLVSSYGDGLSRVCKGCNTADSRVRGYRRLLKRKGTRHLEEMRDRHLMLARGIQEVLDEANPPKLNDAQCAAFCFDGKNCCTLDKGHSGLHANRLFQWSPADKEHYGDYTDGYASNH